MRRGHERSGAILLCLLAASARASESMSKRMKYSGSGGAQSDVILLQFAD
jgi:hypothetical protein